MVVAIASTLWEKLHPFYSRHNLVKSRYILIIFSAQIHERICNKIFTKLSTSPNDYHYTTSWNAKCVNLFITTVMQAVNVMKNYHLLTNTSERMFKLFAFGSDTRIKTISPLINCLISDALLDSRACFNYFFRHLSWMSLRMMRPTDLCKMPVFLVIWRVVLSVPRASSRLSTKSLTAPMFSAVRDVRGLPLPGRRSVVPVFPSF